MALSKPPTNEPNTPKQTFLAHGLGCVRGKTEDDFSKMIFSLDFWLLFYQEKSKAKQTLKLQFTDLISDLEVVTFFIKLKIQTMKFVCGKK